MNKGLTLYLAVIIMSILLALVLGLIAISVTQLKTIRGVENSVVAFYAADAGVEKVLKELYSAIKNETEAKLQPSYHPTTGDFNIDASYDAELVCCSSSNMCCLFSVEACPTKLIEDSNCLVDRYCIRSAGTFNGIKRALEVNYGRGISLTPVEYEFYQEGPSPMCLRPVVSNLWAAQTFTVGSVGHSADYINLYLKPQNNPSGPLIVSIRNVDGSGVPTGPDLCRGSRDLNNLPSGVDGWYSVRLSQCSLSANTQYAIVVRAPATTHPNFIYWWKVNSKIQGGLPCGGSCGTCGNGYSGGALYYSYNFGDTWVIDRESTGMAEAQYDALFQIWLCL